MYVLFVTRQIANCDRLHLALVHDRALGGFLILPLRYGLDIETLYNYLFVLLLVQFYQLGGLVFLTPLAKHLYLSWINLHAVMRALIRNFVAFVPQGNLRTLPHVLRDPIYVDIRNYYALIIHTTDRLNCLLVEGASGHPPEALWQIFNRTPLVPTRIVPLAEVQALRVGPPEAADNLNLVPQIHYSKAAPSVGHARSLH